MMGASKMPRYRALTLAAIGIVALLAAVGLTNPTTLAQTDPVVAPGAPTDVVATPGVNQLAVTWVAPTSGANNAPTNYVVQWKSGGQSFSSTRQHSAGTDLSYTIPSLTPGRQYTVRVRAENSAGGTWSGEASGTPQTGLVVTKVEVTSVTDSTATVKVTITNPESLTETVHLRYRLRGADSWETKTPLTTSTTTRDFSLGRLTPNSNYEVQASLDSEFRIGVRSEDFSTHGAPSVPKLSVAPADRQLKLSWTFSLNGGTVTSQTIEWKESTAPTFTNTANPANNLRSYTIDNLVNDRDYVVRVTVATNYDSKTSEGVTQNPSSGPSLDDITFSSITRTSATASVSVTNAQLARSTLTVYLRYREKGSTDWSDVATRNVSGSTASFGLRGLTFNTMYEVEASLANDFEESVVRVLTTLTAPPGPPESVEVSHGDTELNLSWSAPTNDGGESITAYIVQWQKDGGAYLQSSRQQLASDIHSTQITNLENGTEYTVRIYATNSLGNGASVEVSGTPSTVPGSPPTRVTAAACNQVQGLSWRPPADDGGSPITSYIIQWKSGDQEFDGTRQSVNDSGTPFFALDDLDENTDYTVRVAAVNINVDTENIAANVLWSSEFTATTRPGACVTALEFGNPLATSVPAYVTVTDATPGTNVLLRYRLDDTNAWISTLSMPTEAGKPRVTFDLTELTPSTRYEVEASLDSGFPTTGTIRGFFTTSGDSSNGPTPGDSTARILRFEPGIATVTVEIGDSVVLWVDVYGRQNVLDNGLADRSPSSGRPTFEWDSGGNGSFNEADINPEWKNSEPDDRQVVYVAPNRPGTYQIRARLTSTSDCLGQQKDETSDEAEDRCTAEFTIRVKRPTASGPAGPGDPVNPGGNVPGTDNLDPQGPGFVTPDGGVTTTDDGVSVILGPGAVPPGDIIRIKITPIGPVPIIDDSGQDVTLVGTEYEVTVIDALGATLPIYRFAVPATVCLPVPEEHTGDLSGVGLFVIEDDRGIRLLATEVVTGETGVVVCGMKSVFPANLAVGVEGLLEDEVLDPETGGVAPTRMIVLITTMLGLTVMFLGLNLRNRLRRHNPREKSN